MATVDTITYIRPDGAEWILLIKKGKFWLRTPNLPHEGKNRDENATPVDSLKEAAELIEEGYSIRMVPPGRSRGNYISRASLRITYR